MAASVGDQQVGSSRASRSHEVFVSYSSRDKPVADAIVARLEAAGIRCWFAPRDVLPGMNWAQAIVEAIGSTRLMVMVLSGEANRSHQVLREVERAISTGVVVIPFRIEAVEPTDAMAYYLASEHWLDALTPPLEDHIATLVKVVEAFLDRAPDRGPTLADPNAPTPDRPLNQTKPAPAIDVPAARGTRRRWVVAATAGAILAVVGIAGAAVLLTTRAAQVPTDLSDAPGEHDVEEITPDQAHNNSENESDLDGPATLASKRLKELKAGDCLLTPAKHADVSGPFWGTMPYWPDPVAVVPCSQPHSAAVIFVGDLWDRDAANPGQEAIDAATNTRCDREFEAYIGVPPAMSVFDYQTWNVNAPDWDNGDRQIGCVAFHYDGRDTEASVRGLAE
jgi:hypothetical protein